MRAGLCNEAIRLARLLVALLPDETEAQGLLALMLLHHARRDARIDELGRLVTLEEQDRSRWDGAAIDEAVAILDRAFAGRDVGPYQIQAAIAAIHATARTPEETDWPQIALLYAQLLRYHRSPVIELNRAAAVGMAEGPEAGLELVDAHVARGELADYHLLHAARADLLRRLQRTGEAAAAYRRALELCTHPVEREYLERRLRQVMQ